MQVQQAGVGTVAPSRAPIGLRLGAGLIGGAVGGATASAVLPGQFAGEQFLGGGVSGDFLVRQQRDQAVLEGAEAAFDFTFGLGTWGDEVGDAERGEGALELGAGIASVGGGHRAEQGQAIGVKGQGQTVDGEEAAEMLEVMPGGVGGNEGGPEEFAGMVIDREQQGLFILGGPPLVEGGVVLPEFAEAGTLPAAARFGPGRRGVDQEWEVAAGVGRNRFTVAVEGEAGGQLVGDQLVVGGPLEGQEGLEELLDLGGPGGVMAAPGESGGESRGLVKPAGAQAEEVSAADIQKFSGGEGVQVAAMEGIKRLEEKRWAEASGQLVFFKRTSNLTRTRGASPFVGLRYAPASSRTGPAEGVSFCSPQPVSFCSRPDKTIFWRCLAPQPGVACLRRCLRVQNAPPVRRAWWIMIEVFKLRLSAAVEDSRRIRTWFWTHETEIITSNLEPAFTSGQPQTS